MKTFRVKDYIEVLEKDNLIESLNISDYYYENVDLYCCLCYNKI